MDNEETLMTLITRPERVMSHGSGSWLYDEQERRYLDFVQGWAVNALGHAAPELTEVIATQASRLLTVSPAYYTRPLLELCAAVCRATKLDRVFLANSGAEANDAAIKLARCWAQTHRPGAFRVVTAQGGFHGRTLACVAASGKEGWENVFPPMLDGFIKVPFGDIEAIQAAIDDSVCAVMLEPIQGEAGIVMPPAGYLKAVAALCAERGVLFIADEIQTGVGRTGTFLRTQAAGVKPDILTLGKGLGGGVPIAALVATEEAAAFRPGDHGGTYVGNPLCASVALALLSIVDDPRFLNNVTELGAYLRVALQKVADSSSHKVVEIRGAGLLWACEFEAPIAHRVRDLAFESGLLINAPGQNVIRVMPQLRVSRDEIDELQTRLLDVLSRC